MNKPFSKFLLFLGSLFVICITVTWLFQMPSKEEAFGDLGKFWDIRQGGFTSWSSHFLLGGSMALQQVSIGIIFLANLFLTFFGTFLGELAAFKLVGITSLAASGVTMFFFVRRLTKEASQAMIAALAYMIMPSITVALGIYEHFSVTLCFVFVPLILRGLLVLSEEASPREIVGLGVAASAMALSYTKIAVVITPMLLLWTLEILRLQPAASRGKILRRYAISGGVAALLAFPFLLPAAREFRLAAGFLLEPLNAWQHHYSFKSALQWIDLWGFFMKGSGPDVEQDAMMFVVGVIPVLVVSLGLGLSALEAWRRSSHGRWFLILVACWLFSLSLAAGPDGLLLGHWHLLKNNAHDMADIAIPCLWLALAWLAWLSYQTIHGLIGGQAWRTWLLLGVFLATPFFRIAAHIPLFSDIRAPESFWSVGGFCALAAAVGIGISVLFQQWILRKWRLPVAIVIGAFCVLEYYPIYSAYGTRALPEELFSDYNQAVAFLKKAPLPGRVHPLCSRYFYLTLPQETGRSLSTESLLRHFQLRWVRCLEAAGMANPETMKSYFNLAGISYILIDKEDPLTPRQLQETYRSLFPVVFENRSLVILVNQSSLYPAFLARNFVALPVESYQALAPMSLQLARMNFLGVELSAVAPRQVGFSGKATGNNQVELFPQYQQTGGAPFLRVASQVKSEHDNRMTYHLPPTSAGWLTISEAFHPDWQAFIDGQPVSVYRAAAALLAVYVPLGSQEITFQFVPPFWYGLSFWGGCLFWFLALGSFPFFLSRWASSKAKQWWS